MVNLDTKEYAKLLFTIGPQKHKKRRALSPLMVAEYIKVLLDNDNNNYELVSNRIDLSTKQITEFLKLLRIPKTVQEVITWGNDTGKIDFSTAAKIADLNNLEDMDKLSKLIALHNLKKQETDDIIKLLKKNSDLTFDETVERVLKLRPIIEKGYAVVLVISNEERQTIDRITIETDCKVEVLLKELFSPYIDIPENTIKIKDNVIMLILNEQKYSELKEIPNLLGISEKNLIRTLLKKDSNDK
jgi:hypothetical protein